MSTIKAAVEALLDPTRSVEEAAAAHYAPTFRQCTDGVWEDRATVIERIAGLRDLRDVSLEVLHEHDDGAGYAEHHVIDLVAHDGTTQRIEAMVFARRDPAGRFTWIEELSRPMDTDPA